MTATTSSSRDSTDQVRLSANAWVSRLSILVTVQDGGRRPRPSLPCERAQLYLLSRFAYRSLQSRRRKPRYKLRPVEIKSSLTGAGVRAS